MFKKGEIVGLLEAQGRGRIIHVLENNRYLVLVEEFDMEIPLHENELYSIQTDVILPMGEVHQKHVSHKIEATKRPNQTEVIDLHIEKIPMNFKRGLVDLEAQVLYFERCLQTAISNRKQEIVFVHGKGNGILKSRIARVLRDRNLKFHDPEKELNKQNAKMMVRLR